MLCRGRVRERGREREGEGEREPKQSRKGRERWEESEEVGARSLVPLTETRKLTPEDEGKEEEWRRREK